MPVPSIKYQNRIVDSTCCTFKAGSFSLNGVQKMAHSCSVSRSPVKKAGSVGVSGYSRGTLEYDGSISLLKADASDFEAWLETQRTDKTLQGGVWDVSFALSVLIRTPAFVEVATLFNCKISPSSFDMGGPDGGDAIATDYQLIMTNRQINGLFDWYEGGT